MHRIPTSASRILWCTCLALLATLSAAGEAPTPGADKHPIRVACAGDSITARGYPEVLQRLLGPGYTVRNLGHSGVTAMKDIGTRSYPLAKPQQDDIDIVVVMLGTNDAKTETWSAHKEAFAKDYRELIQSFKAIASKPRVYVSLSPPVFKPETGNGFSPKNVEEMVEITRTLAGELGCPVIDVHAAATGHADLFSDGVHPNDLGKELIAKTVMQALTAHDAAR
jgi:sialate O-acetylesterase